MAKQTHLLLRENRSHLRSTLANVDRTTGEVAGLAASANALVTGVDTMALERSLESLTVTMNQFRGLLARVVRLLDHNQDQVRATIYNLRLAAESLKEFGRSLERRPSRLLFDESPEERTLP